MRTAPRVAAVDVVVAFAVFVATTRSSPGTAISYGSIVVVGSFQLQTYAPVITIGALSGIWAGLTAGLASAALYPVALVAIGRSVDGIFGPPQIASTVSRAVLYVFFGAAFGVFHALVAEAREARERQLEAEVRQREAEVLHERAEASEREREQELRLLHRFHTRGLGKLGVVRQNLYDLSGQLQGEVAEDLLGLARGFDAILSGLRDLTSSTPGSKTIAQVLKEVHANHLMQPLYNKARPVVLEFDEADLGAAVELSPRQTDHLEAIVSEAVGNAKKHARPGNIVISGASRGSREFMIVVLDPGPAESPGRGFSLGHETISEYAREHGWWWNWEPARNRHDGGRVRLIIPLRGGSDGLAWRI